MRQPALAVRLERRELRPVGLHRLDLAPMACGTPVIALKRGVIPEVVEHRRTGFVVEEVTEMAPAVAKVSQLERAECRRHVEERFSA